MEFLSPIALILLFTLAVLLVGWLFLSRFEALLREKKEDQSLLLMQQQIDQLRIQLSQALDNNAQLVQQQLGQVLGNVNERLKENGEILRGHIKVLVKGSTTLPGWWATFKKA